jgi:hypothetical protein
MIGPLVIAFVRDFISTAHVGRAKAIDRSTLLAIVQGHGFDIDDRELRKIYADELHLPACPFGIFWPETQAEIDEAEVYFRKKFIGQIDRISGMKKAFGYLAPDWGLQLILGLEERP